MLAAALLALALQDAAPKVVVVAVPDAGLQPQVAVGPSQRTHLVYFRGEPRAGDLWYASIEPDGVTLTEPIRVNTHPQSAAAIGTIRGAQMALGADERVHVAWVGSDRAEPKAAGGGLPMLYTRLADGGRAFEAERNVIAAHPGLDGGGSVAADGKGGVAVVWHAPADAAAKEQRAAQREVWLARSKDEGVTFAPEVRVSSGSLGACECCSLKALMSPGRELVLFRAAKGDVQRDLYALVDVAGAEFKPQRLSTWKAEQCVMSSSSAVASPRGTFAAWEEKGQVFMARLDDKTGKFGRPVPGPGAGGARKHPSVAVNAKGQVLLAWSENAGWEKGGDLAWQVFDADLRPIEKATGFRSGLPVWSFGAAFARPDGGFGIFH